MKRSLISLFCLSLFAAGQNAVVTGVAEGSPDSTLVARVFRTVAEPAACTQDLGSAIPPPLPAGSLEEGPVGNDPLGNWGPVESGAQLSLRLATNRFVVGQMVTAYVILRNDSRDIVEYNFARLQGGLCNFSLWNAEELRGIVLPLAPRSIVHSQILRGTQHRSWARLDKVFDLSRPGRYVVRAISCLVLDKNGTVTTVVSGPVQVEIMAPSPPPESAEKEKRGGP